MYMTNRITQYIKDTRGALRHVAWPTQSKTIVYTIIIAGISIFVALYLGLFDYVFTTGLGKTLQTVPAVAPVSIDQQPATTTGLPSTPPAGGPGQAVPTFDTDLGGATN